MKQSKSPGIWIAFLGPDGVGKSAVIDRLQSQFHRMPDCVTRYHFRPRFRRQAEERPPVTCPHAQPPRTLLVSLAKLIYWLADCWYGYLVAVRPLRQGSGLVIFDRYYPDVLVDPLRYRLPKRSIKFARWLLRFAPEPDLYIMLDAPAEIVQQRKSELTLKESSRQRIAYLKMFEGLRNKLLVDANRPVAEVTRNIGVALRGLPRSPLFERHGSSLLAGL
jgi:thymidylate kinase